MFCKEKPGFEFKLTGTNKANVVATDTTQIKLSDDGTTNNIVTSCSLPAGAASADYIATCKITPSLDKAKEYTLRAQTITETDKVKLIIPTDSTNKIAINADYNPLDATQTTSVVFDYTNTELLSFTIKYTKDLVAASLPEVTAGLTKLTNCTITDPTKKKELGCTAKKGTLEFNQDDAAKVVEYKISVTNACKEVEETGITLKVSNGYMLQISTLLLVAIGVLLA